MLASRIAHRNFTSRFVNLTLYYCLSFSSLGLAYHAIRNINIFDYHDIQSVIYMVFGGLLFGLAIYYFYKSIYSVAHNESQHYQSELLVPKNFVNIRPNFKWTFPIKNLQVMIGLISITWLILTLSFFGDFSYLNVVWFFAGFLFSHALLFIQTKIK